MITNPQITELNDILTSLGFTGTEQIDFARLSKPQFITDSISHLRSMKYMVDQSGLDMQDKTMLLIELKCNIINQLSQWI